MYVFVKMLEEDLKTFENSYLHGPAATGLEQMLGIFEVVTSCTEFEAIIRGLGPWYKESTGIQSLKCYCFVVQTVSSFFKTF